MPPTILLVDDDHLPRRTLAQVLQRLGYYVIEAEDGGEALAAARSVTPDLVLSDYFMPVMNGAQLLQELRADPVLQRIPFILISGYVDRIPGEPDMPQPDLVLAKPVTIARLAAAIDSTLHRGAG
jgi:CheY-like chemotaxis protein